MVIRFAPLSDTEMQQYLIQVLGESESLEKTQLLAKIALGRPGILQKILESISLVFVKIFGKDKCFFLNSKENIGVMEIVRCGFVDC